MRLQPRQAPPQARAEGSLIGGAQKEAPTPAQRNYTPWGASEILFYNRDPEVLVSGPAGTGKSRGALEKLHIICCKYPGVRCLMARKTRRSLRQSAQVTYEQKVLPPLFPVYFHGGDEEYRYPNGSVIVVGGLDKASKVMSSEYDVIYIMEATELDEDDYEALTTRVRNGGGSIPYQQIIGDCNPNAPGHWLKRRADRGAITLLNSYHQDNPVLWDPVAVCQDCQGRGLIKLEGRKVGCETCRATGQGYWTKEGVRYVKNVLEKLTGVRKERLLWGKWVGAEGLVFDAWVLKKNRVKRFDIPRGWRRYRAIDFGYQNPFVCQWYAQDPDGRLYLYREIVGVGRRVDQWGETIKKYTGGEPILATITDHDAEDRATLEATLGTPTIPAHKSIRLGIQATNRRLGLRGDGWPGLMVFSDALRYRDEVMDSRKEPQGVLEEIDSYVWAKSASGLITKEVPVDRYNHSMDAMRYMVMHVDAADFTGGADVDVDLDRIDSLFYGR